MVGLFPFILYQLCNDCHVIAEISFLYSHLKSVCTQFGRHMGVEAKKFGNVVALGAIIEPEGLAKIIIRV